MTAVVEAPVTPPPAAAKPARKRRRWHRFAVPYAVVLVLFIISGVSRAWEEPDFDEAGTLSPAGTGPDGSSQLAAMLAQRGITIERYTRSTDAVAAARSGNATVFVPAANFMHPLMPYVLSTVSDTNRLVLVEPGLRTLLFSGLPVALTFQRWAPLTPAPDCADPVARQAGRATVLRTGYASYDDIDPEGDFGTTNRYRCYDGGLAGMRWMDLDLVLVGATDPFRNSRIGEYGNAALATGLLSAKPRVIWVELGGAEPRTFSTFEGGRPGIDLPDNEGGQPGGGSDNPLFTVFPPWVWAVVVQLTVIAVLLALWRARRLGPPVAEPLPVTVPAAETVTGRGRLYDRADARGPAIDALRAAVRRRIAPALDLPPEAPEADVVSAVAARTGRPADHVRTVLYGREPEDDDQLLAAVAALDELAHRLSFTTLPKEPR